MLHNKTIAQLIHGLRSKEFSSFELTKHYLQRIETFKNDLNSFITITEADALTQAKRFDNLLAKNSEKIPALAGIPIAYKDNFCTHGAKTTCSSKMLESFVAPYDATVVARLKKAGCIMLGKTNMDEFAMGSSGENSYFGPAKNPWNLSKVPGGSSSGSASAVAARLTPIALGTDTGGSVRQPAAFCGISGLKPTYGLVSRFGIAAFASSFDQAGIFASSAEDIAYILPGMAGFDEKDSTSVSTVIPDYTKTLNRSLKGLKVGISRDFWSEKCSEEILKLIEEAIKELQKLGAVMVDISIPTANLALPVYYVIAPAECSSNLARYDGVRYGYRCSEPKNLADLYIRSRSEGFGAEVKRRIMIGTYVLSAGYYDAYYLQAQKVRRLIKNDFSAAFNKVDVILSPTSPTVAFSLHEKELDPVSMYFSDIYTVPVNLAGLAGISVPIGFSKGLPIGMQLVGNYFSEALLLNVAHQYQKVTEWHTKVPAQFN